jgi:polyphosphate kinase
MQARIMQECIEPYLDDTEDAWMPTSNGEYRQQTKVNARSAQKTLIKRYSAE